MTEQRPGAPVAGAAAADALPGTRGPQVRLGPLVATLFVVSLLGALEITIVGSSLATIVGELGGLSAMAWVVTAYALASTVAMPVFGQLGDIHGRRRLFLIALVLFVVGSLLCGLAPSMLALTISRGVQGVGAAGTALLSQTILADVLPPRQRAKYMGLLGTVFGVATVVGPVVGGVLTDSFGWRWVFLFIVPFGVAALAVAKATIPALPRGRPGAPFDAGGAVLLCVSLSALVLLVTLGGSVQPWLSPGSALLLAVALSTFVALYLVERRSVHPILPFQMFRDPTVVGATVLALVGGVGLLSVISYLPAYSQMRYSTSATVAGLVPIAIVAGIMLSTNATGWLVSHTGRYRVYPLVGSALAAAAYGVAAARLDVLSLAMLCLLFFLVGTGAGSFMQLSIVIAQNQSPLEYVGVTTSTVNLVRAAGMSVGTAVIGTAISLGLVDRLRGVEAWSASATGLRPAEVVAAGPEVESAVADAYAGALTPVLAGLAAVFVVGLVAAVVMPTPPLRASR